jgi:hypothetical protein
MARLAQAPDIGNTIRVDRRHAPALQVRYRF